MAKIVIDACAWIEHFIGSEKGRKVDEILFEADELFTPDTVLAEIASKYIREGIELETVNQRLNEATEASNIYCVVAKLAVIAAQCYLELETNSKKNKSGRPSLFDAIVLATAKLLKSKVLTGDQHFRSLPETVWIE